MTAPKKTVPMCCMTIGFDHYLMPVEAGTKIFSLMQKALKCELVFDDKGYFYAVGGAPAVKVEVVSPRQVRPATETETRLLGVAE